MYQLVYTSTAIKPFGQLDLRLLLLKARHANAISHITGVLLYHKGFFLQVLEGEKAEVEATFASIMRDRRHRAIEVRSRECVASREFPSWTMGFFDTGAWNFGTGPAAYDTIPQFAAADSNARRYLRLFHTGLFSLERHSSTAHSVQSHLRNDQA